MTKRDLHSKPDPCPQDPCCKNIHITCECNDTSDTDWWRIHLLFIITWILIFLLSILATCVWWYYIDKGKKGIPEDIVYAIEQCADEGSIHDNLRPPFTPTNDSVGWLEGRPPPGRHPEGVCKDIKKIIHQSIHYCKDCEEKPDDPKKPETPLVLGGSGVAIEIEDDPECMGRIKDIVIDNTPAQPNQRVRFDGADIDLPQFCPSANNPNREWELLERPRVHHARTKDKPLNPDNELIGGPYTVFIAKHLDGYCCDDRRGAVPQRDKDRITVFILYLDWVTEQPTVVEFDVEVERGKNVVSQEDTVQLISNVRLNSIDKQITFQIGQGAQRIVIAGYDFGPQSTRTDTGRRRRSDQDTSGSYRVLLSDDAAVKGVERVP